MHILGCCCRLLVRLEVDEHVARAVTHDSTREIGGAGGELPVSLGGLDVAQGVEGGAVLPASGVGGS